MNDDMIERIGEQVRIDLMNRGKSYTFQDVVKTAFSALTPADLEALLPEGWVVVPVKLTDDMTNNAKQAFVEEDSA